MHNIFKNKYFPNWVFLNIILFIVPVILILAFKMHAETLLQYPAFDIFITSWIHYGSIFLTGNVIGWLVLFPCLTLMIIKLDRIKRVVLLTIIGLPIFSSLIEIVIYGGVRTGAWGFSGILFAIYGLIIFYTIAGLQYYLTTKELSKALKLGILLITIIVALSPVLLTPSIVSLQNNGFLFIDTIGHQLGLIWGLLVCIVIYRDRKELEVKYWIFGMFAIMIQAISFSGYWLP
jgi:hypothetical protein